MKAPLRRREIQIGFDALSIEGGLLQPEWLARIARLEAVRQRDADYEVLEGLNLRDEISRYWRAAQAQWSRFAAGRAQKADAGELSQRFVPTLLQTVFGFSTLRVSPSLVVSDRVYPIGHAALDGRVPVIIAPAGSGLDALHPAFGEGGRRRSAFGLAQEALNATDGALWGLCTDGLTLRALRDNASLTRPAWIQADLERIFTEERYADFAALWLLIHESRFGRPGQPAADCPLELWRSAGREEGTRAREHLRRGVEDALAALGQGFVAHPDNQALRAALEQGTLTDRAFFNQLLRLVYRLIFLITVEERELLHPQGRRDAARDAARELYAEGYSLRRLRERSARRAAHDRHADAWETVKIVFRGLARGEERLDLPALAGIFAADQCPALDTAKLENRALLLAVFRLSWLRDKAGLARVNWRDMGPEELGSVYESLLELVPRVSVERRSFGFAEGDEAKGHARKTTGSYYTPDSLVQVLLDSALEPVIQDTIAANPRSPAPALLALSIVDPACGSGHFLLAAARRLAGHVARLKAGGTPSAEQYRRALREVVGKCIYGVDLNPMAVELCKVALWMEAVEPGLPLSFLDAHIRQGNALLGATPELMDKGVPDAAWEPIEGDDRKTASALKKRNSKERGGQKSAVGAQQSMLSRWSSPTAGEVEQVAQAVAELDAAPDEQLGDIEGKETRWSELLRSGSYQHQKFVADAWCAAFVWPKPKDGGPVVEAAPTDALWRDVREGRGQPPGLMIGTVAELAEQYEFFHWHLAFPTVFQRGGFDVVLGNPPWERVKLQEQEFFASKSEGIAGASNAAARKKLIAALPETDPGLWRAWCAASREAEGQSHLVRQSGRYPLCGKGDVNTYALFAEHNRSVLGPRGRAGFIVPTGIATDDTTKEYFGALVESRQLRSLYDFQTGPGLFVEIGHARFKFCLLTLGTGQESADLLFFARSIAELNDRERHFTLSSTDLAILNPDSRTCPTFRSHRDAKVNLELYRRAGIFWGQGGSDGNPWRAQVHTRLWHMAEDSQWFQTTQELEEQGWSRIGNRLKLSDKVMLPLLEAKMLHHYDHRYGDYADKPADSESTSLPDVPLHQLQNPDYTPTPRYWVPMDEVETRLASLWARGWLLGWRDICRSFDERTVIATLIPRVAVGHNTPLLFSAEDPKFVAALYADLSSLALDYATRQKVGGTHLTVSLLKQLPILPPSAYLSVPPWLRGEPTRDWILPRVLELTYTAWDLQPFAVDCGYDGPPFRWDPARRALLRAELDAAFFHLYALSKDDAEYILDTFPIVRKNDEKTHGEYRTKSLILKRYEAMAEAARTGQPYATVLDPPPADARVAHPPRAQAATARAMPDLAALAPEAWVRPGLDARAETGAALTAVLKRLEGPKAARAVRLAALLVLEPRLLLHSLPADKAQQWRRLVGVECDPLPAGVVQLVPIADHAWGAAVRHHRANGLLIEDATQDTWAPGPGLDAIETAGWPDGRTAFVLDVLASQGAETVTLSLPEPVRRSLDAAAA